MAKEQRDCWVGFDLGGTKMLATVLDADFNKLGSKRRRTKGHEGVEAGLERIQLTISEALEDAGVGVERLAGIGVGSPGPLDLDRGVILETPNLGWKDVALRKVLEKGFDCPAVIANDVDAGVYGEYRFGAGKKARCVVGVFPGTGIGGGCVYEGRILRGKTGSCLEIGHLPVIPEGPICGCGRRGCLEAIASRLAISSAAAAAAYRGEAPYLLEHAGTDISQIRSGMLAASVKAGDAAVEEVIREAGWWIGYAMAGVVHVLAPDVVLLGGGLVEAMPQLLLEEVEHAMNEHLMPSFVGSFRTAVAKLGDDATVLGAAAWAQECVATGLATGKKG
jgi:glucokinase